MDIQLLEELKQQNCQITCSCVLLDTERILYRLSCVVYDQWIQSCFPPIPGAFLCMCVTQIIFM